MKNILFELAHIAQAISQAKDSNDQVNTIVASICQSMQIDVCSLYMVSEHEDLVLLASRGLTTSSSAQIILPRGKGLVGMVVQSRHPINLAQARAHPNYFYLPETQEERFSSFCGVPVVVNGAVIAVLVVQACDARLLSDEEEAFLVTLSAQLAPMIKNVYQRPNMQNQANIHISGICGATGFAIAKASLCTSQQDLLKVGDAHCEYPEQEIQQWRNILDKVRRDIKREQASLNAALPSSITAIFDAYHLLLSDASLITNVETAIRAGNWLPGALRKTIQRFSNVFMSMEDAYLKTKHEDIKQLGNKLYQAWLGIDKTNHDYNEAVILVGRQVSISDIANIPITCLAGIISFEGSSLSHISVLANAIGIPAVMGVGSLHNIQNGETLIIDGHQHRIILRPSQAICAEYQTLIEENRQLITQLQALHNKPAQTTDGALITLYANTGLLTDVTPGLQAGAQGIGLYRTEIPFMMHAGFPSEEEQVEIYRSVLDAYAGKPVYMRTLDIGSDKQLPYFPIANEDNPALGYRGIRFSLDNIQLLMTQIRAMLRASVDHKQLHILLPMVSAHEELTVFSQLLEDAIAQLQQEQISINRPKIGIMIEVPAAISQLPFWTDKLDFASIGSNDLSQYLLALDRNNAHVSSRYDHVHPAVLHEIARIIHIAKKTNLPLSLCGEMASDPQAVVLLIGLGLRTLSMSAAQLPKIKHLIRSISIQQAEAIAAQALTLADAKSIRAHVSQKLPKGILQI